MKIITSKFEDIKSVRKFKFHYQNRKVEAVHVKKLRKTLFKDGVWNTIMPVVVNILTGNILDGQHRWSLYLQLIDEGLINPKDTPLYVEYVEMSPKEEHSYITELQEANHWDNEDFCESYVSGGNPNYITIKQFCDEHPLCKRVNKAGMISGRAYRLANIILTGDRNEKHLKDGLAVVSREDVTRGHAIHNEMQKILQAIKIESTVGRNGLEGLASAWRELRQAGYPMKDWIKELSKEKYEGGPKTNKTWGVNTWNEFLSPACTTLLLKKNKATA